MDTPAFTIGQALRFGWDKTKEHLWFLICVILIMMALTVIPTALQSAIGQSHPVLSALIALSALVLQLITVLGVIKIALNILDTNDAALGDLFDTIPLFFRYLRASILYCLICAGGLILLIFPGVIWIIKYQFYPYFIVDKGAQSWESMQLSAAVTQGHKWHLLGFGLVLVLINIAGICALGVGLLVTILISINATTFVYRALLKAQQNQPGVISPASQATLPPSQAPSIQDGSGI
jgi:uncharacterized membrane protein